MRSRLGFQMELQKRFKIISMGHKRSKIVLGNHLTSTGVTRSGYRSRVSKGIKGNQRVSKGLKGSQRVSKGPMGIKGSEVVKGGHLTWPVITQGPLWLRGLKGSQRVL